MQVQSNRGPLAGVRVLDLADETGILATKLLAGLGADVLRIEPPEGDPLRRLGPFAEDLPDPERGLTHWWFNAGKRSAVLDLGTVEGRAKLAELAGQAEIVVETGGHGLDLGALREARPALTIVSISGFGQSGPRRDWLAPDLITWALGGALIISGLPGRAPIHANWGLANQVAGLYGAVGALAGLAQSRSTGQGRHFDLSRQEAMSAMVEAIFLLYLYNEGARQTRMGVEHPSAVPWGAFPTQDGQVIFIPLTQGQWTTLTAWMVERGDADPWLLDEALVPMAARVPRRARLHEALGRWTSRFTSADLVAEANRRRLPCAPINSPRDVFEDEQLRARGFFVPVDQPVIGRSIEWPGLPYRFPSGATVRPAPRLGEHAPEFPGKPAAAAAPARAAGSGQEWPLGGLKVLDFTWAVAGPTGTCALGDLGAEVIKIEPPGLGDLLRGLPPHWHGQSDPNHAAMFHRFNRNKRNLTVDLKKPAGRALIKRLAAWADVVVDNFGAGVLSRLGLGPEELAAENPALIQISLSGYGQTGPHRNYPSYALISAARGGLVYSTAYPDGARSGPAIAIGDTGAGLLMACAILAAVEERHRTGQGSFVDMSQLEAAVTFVGPPLLEAAVNDHTFVPSGNLLPDRPAAPHGVYPALGDDRWIAIACLDESHWQALAKSMGRPELTADPRFAGAADRVAHVEALDALVGAWTGSQDAHDLADRLQAAGVPAGAVQDAADLLERDPQMAARGFFQTVDHPEIGPIRMDSLPLRWTPDPPPIRAPAPRIGEYNEYVVREVLGLPEEDYVGLLINEVI